MCIAHSLIACDSTNDFGDVFDPLSNQSASGQNPGANSSSSCDQLDLNRWIYDVMHDTYLWYEHTPQLDYERYSDANLLLQDLRFKKYDRFSYLIDEQDYNNSQQGLATAFGFQLGLYKQRYLFRYIEPGSPMQKAGIKRGDELLAIGGITLSEMSSKQFNELTDTSQGPNTQTFTIIDRDSGISQTHEVTSATFSVQTVFNQTVHSPGGVKTGYLGFSRFMRTSGDELNQAFESFKQEQIKDLVVDLRYNGGGLIYIAAQLGGLISGKHVENQLFTTLKFNDRYSGNNLEYRFTTTQDALDLQRLIILSTGSTCSASEMLINGLAPHIDVVTIGGRTCGKPIGMVPQSNCEKTLFAINFESRNALDEGEYFNGLEVNCSIADSAEQDMWSENDPLFSGALNYIVTENCPLAAQSRHVVEGIPVRPIKPKEPDWDLF